MRCRAAPIFEENSQDKFKGIDIMRTVRSFDPCLPCGVHMYLGNGKILEQRHSPIMAAAVWQMIRVPIISRKRGDTCRKTRSLRAVG